MTRMERYGRTTNKHGEEVGAKNAEQYLRKAEEFAKNAKKGLTKSRVSGEVEGIIRFKTILEKWRGLSQ